MADSEGPRRRPPRPGTTDDVGGAEEAPAPRRAARSAASVRKAVKKSAARTAATSRKRVPPSSTGETDERPATPTRAPQADTGPRAEPVRRARKKAAQAGSEPADIRDVPKRPAPKPLSEVSDRRAALRAAFREAAAAAAAGDVASPPPAPPHFAEPEPEVEPELQVEPERENEPEPEDEPEPEPEPADATRPSVAAPPPLPPPPPPISSSPPPGPPTTPPPPGPREGPATVPTASQAGWQSSVPTATPTGPPPPPPKEPRGGGSKLVILVVAIVGAVLLLILLGVLVGNAIGGGGKPYADLQVGDCFEEPAEQFNAVKTVPCDQEHDLEVYALLDYPAAPEAPFPGMDELVRYASQMCLGKFRDYAGVPFESLNLKDVYITPRDSAWEDGARRMVCAVSAANEEPTSSSVRAGAS